MLKPMNDSNDITDTSVSGNSNNNTAADGELFIQQAKDYYSYNILHKITSFFHSSSTTNTNTNNQSYLQDQKPDTANVKERHTKDPFLKRILVVDDEPNVTFTFVVGLKGYYYDGDEKRRFKIYPYNNPIVALSEFKPNFYDLLLTDIYMPGMNGLELYQKIVEVDPNIRVCFMSAAEVNIEALREVYPKVSFGCFIKKPVTIDKLVKRLLAELD
jgi:CheY-like chemotaxis protein